MRNRIREQFDQDGYVVLDNFLTPAEADELRAVGEEMALNVPQDERRCVFSTTQTQQSKDRYFLESGDRVSYFYESGALADDGSLLVDPRLALNKVGHALHERVPAFKRVTVSDRMRETCFQLGLRKPAIAQSMYIYKNPGIGGEVIPHQDATFLYVEPPDALVGFWIALEDATVENGCLWFAPGSHRSGLHRRSSRNPDKNAEELLIYDRGAPVYPRSNFTPVPVTKGSCVLIHGLVVHQSERNKTDKSRNAYTFHVVDLARGEWAPDNWLQPTADLPFPVLYDDKTQ